MTDDFSQAYTQFLVETLGEDGKHIAQNDLEERNPVGMKQRLDEMLEFSLFQPQGHLPQTR